VYLIETIGADAAESDPLKAPGIEGSQTAVGLVNTHHYFGVTAI
jgi:hypothetical protein